MRVRLFVYLQFDQKVCVRLYEFIKSRRTDAVIPMMGSDSGSPAALRTIYMYVKKLTRQNQIVPSCVLSERTQLKCSVGHGSLEKK